MLRLKFCSLKKKTRKEKKNREKKDAIEKRLVKKHKTSKKDHKSEQCKESFRHKIFLKISRKGVRVEQWCVKKSPKKIGSHTKKRATLPVTELLLFIEFLEFRRPRLYTYR